MLYSEAKKQGAAILGAAGIEDAEVDAEYLLLRAAGLDRSRLFMMFSEIIPKETEKRYEELINRRCSHEPLQYILGDQDFMGYTFMVSDDVLIPRLDTEILAELSVKRAEEIINGMIKEASLSHYDFRYIDLCTGSGCVAIAVGLEIKKYLSKKINSVHEDISYRKQLKNVRIDLTGSDISEAAVRQAEQNWGINSHIIDEGKENIQVKFIKSDLFENAEGRYNMITANPPYIVRNEIDTLSLEIKEHEPHLALDGGEDGMDFYRIICKESPQYLLPYGRLLMEFDDAQAEPVRCMMENAGFTDIEVHKDLAGLRRVIEGRYIHRIDQLPFL